MSQFSSFIGWLVIAVTYRAKEEEAADSHSVPFCVIVGCNPPDHVKGLSAMKGWFIGNLVN